MEPSLPIIMTVDDESSVRRVIRTVLEREGYSVREAANGPEALDLIKAEPEIAMVLSDMRMPGMDGNALAHEIFAVRPNIPLIFISAFESELDDRLRHCSSLAKPFSGKQLISRVRTQLARAAGA